MALAHEITDDLGRSSVGWRWAGKQERMGRKLNRLFF